MSAHDDVGEVRSSPAPFVTSEYWGLDCSRDTFPSGIRWPRARTTPPPYKSRRLRRIYPPIGKRMPLTKRPTNWPRTMRSPSAVVGSRASTLPSVTPGVCRGVVAEDRTCLSPYNGEEKSSAKIFEGFEGLPGDARYT